MERIIKKYIWLFSICLILVMGCDNLLEKSEITNTTNNRVVDSDNGLKSSKIINNTDFSLWQSCSTKPYLIPETNGICIPVGGTECVPNYLGAQQKGGQYATGMLFTGCFKGGTNAPDGSNEMAVFICDNVTEWTGREMGFVMTLNDYTLKAYIQSPSVYLYKTISSGYTGYHTYKCQVRSESENSIVDFYVDGVYKCTLSNPNVNYWNNWYYYVGTTHRTSGNWLSNGQQIEMYDMTVY